MAATPVLPGPGFAKRALVIREVLTHPPTWRRIYLTRHIGSDVEDVARLRNSLQQSPLICEQPKIRPHRDAMRQRLAEILDIAVDQVSVKATTTEGMGFTGRGEGLLAQAVATVELPA